MNNLDINKIICISIKSHNQEQLLSIAATYDISYEWLLEQKQNGVKKMWVPIGGGLNVAGLDTDNIEDVYFFPHYLPMTSKMRKAILSLKPIKVPKKPKQLNKESEEKVIKLISEKKTSLNLDEILDKINLTGIESLTEQELNFLKNIK